MVRALESASEKSPPRRRLLRWILLPFVAHRGQATEPGRVYVYARRLTPARSWLPVTCGGAVVAELREGRFFAVILPPGRYTFSAGNGVPRSTDVQPGTDIYLRLDWNHRIGREPIPALSGVRPMQARQEMRHLSYIDPKRIRSETVARQDPREPEEEQLKRRSGPSGPKPG